MRRLLLDQANSLPGLRGERDELDRRRGDGAYPVRNFDQACAL
jgi:hypothetical protein